jgi:hypothetical protein
MPAKKKKAAKKKKKAGTGFWDKFAKMGDKSEPSTSGNKHVAAQLTKGNAKKASARKKAAKKKK